MAKLLISFLLLTSFNIYASGLSIISDLDDTLKVTNVGNFPEAVRNAVFSKRAFKGMPGLLQEMNHYTSELYILTASPKILNSRVKIFLNYNEINYKELFMRNIFGDSDKRAYKLSTVKSVLNNTDDDLILIGDNVEIDHEIYTQIRLENPQRVEEIYIHKIKNTPLPVGVVGYYTAYDIAQHEYLAGRMTFVQAGAIGTKILTERDLSKVIPKFAYCPKKDEDFSRVRVNALTLLTRQINARIKAFCSK